ncbi:MAG: DMT family transporter [Desulfobacterales bacterium]|jgi:drug/metabolite transporter (DMT)-like permease|nr:DMT family transporter [Deltaproteobacteria bacterium]
MQNQNFENPEFSFLAGILSAFLCVIFGSNAVAIKLAFNGLGVFTTAAIRFSIAALAIFVWARLTGQTIGLKKGQLRQVLILAALFAIQLSMFYLGLSKSNASRGTLIANLLPFWVLFLAHFFIPGDRITGRKFLGILLGFGGVAFMFAETKGVTAGFRIGDLIILSATFIWACSAIYLKRIIADFSPFQITLYSMIFSVPIFFLEALLWDAPMVSQLDFKVIGALLYQSLVTAAFGFVAWNTLLQKYGAVALHSFIFIMPISGVSLGGLVLGEPITVKILIALALIVAGILIVHLKPRKAEPVYPIRKGI